MMKSGPLSSTPSTTSPWHRQHYLQAQADEFPSAEIHGESVAVLQSSNDQKAWAYTEKESAGEFPKPLEACDRSYIPLPAEK